MGPFKGGQSLVKVAVVQTEPRVGIENKESNLDKTLAMIDSATAEGATLVVLPELCNTGYAFSDRAEAFAHGEEIPAGPTTQRWLAKAKEKNAYIVAGIAEREGHALFNTAVLLGPGGFIGKYRKNHLWYEEKLFFTPGDMGLPVYETPIGRIGMLICWDNWFPETYRILALQGADIVCTAANWLWNPPPLFDSSGKTMGNIQAMAAAHCNSMFVAAAARTGTERGIGFVGCSLIIDTSGWLLAGPASPDKEEILTAEINLVESRRAKALNDLNNVVHDRRIDIYDSILGYEAAKSVN